MTDIVEQLRDLQSGAQWVCGATAKTLSDAADEIERLRAEVELARSTLDAASDEIDRLLNEMELACAIAQVTGLEYRGG